MTDLGDDRSMFHDGLYRETFSAIGTLRSRLPENAFESLAREVIRRLSDHPVMLSSALSFPSEAKIDELARALLRPNPLAGISFIDRIRAQGASVEMVYVAYLSEAAKRLGVWWENDEISFAEVTIGTGHIYAVMRGLKPMFRSTRSRSERPEALFAAVPGENHQLGIEMAADMATKQGWDITLKRDLDHDALVGYAAGSDHTVIGLTAAGEHSLTELARLIIALRISAPRASILVSGAVTRTARDVVAMMGPDAVEPDFDQAMRQLDALWRQGDSQADVG